MTVWRKERVAKIANGLNTRGNINHAIQLKLKTLSMTTYFNKSFKFKKKFKKMIISSLIDIYFLVLVFNLNPRAEWLGKANPTTN